MFVNCPNETVLTDPFMPTSMDEIEVTDNSGADRSSLYITVSIVHLVSQCLSYLIVLPYDKLSVEEIHRHFKICV